MRAEIKNGYQQFSQGTSIHGFIELYNAKSKFWKLFWLVVVSASMGITVFQVYETIEQYFHQTSATVIEPLANDEVEYPPIKLCPLHWVNWIDWEMAFKLKFSKESVLYGMSFLGNVYVNSEFDEKNAREQFLTTMTENNMSTLTDFFIAVSKPYPSGIGGGSGIRYNISELFVDKEMMVSQVLYDVALLCYVAPFRRIRDLIQFQKQTLIDGLLIKNNELIFQIAVEQIDFAKSELTREENDLNVLKFFETNAHLSENIISKPKVPILLYPNSYDSRLFVLAPDGERYQVQFQASVNIFKNKKNSPCVPGVRTVVTQNAICLRICNVAIQNYGNLKNCIPYALTTSLGINASFENLCQFNITTVNDVIDSSTATPTFNSNNISDQPKKNRNVFSPQSINETFKHCIKPCGVDGCEKWTYDWHMSTISIVSPSVSGQRSFVKNYSIRMEYPTDGTVLVMTEIDSQTWENFVGSVGGLLGIWTGASIVSFIQMIYLCCCSENSNIVCDISSKERKVSARRVVQNLPAD